MPGAEGGPRRRVSGLRGGFEFRAAAMGPGLWTPLRGRARARVLQTHAVLLLCCERRTTLPRSRPYLNLSAALERLRGPAVC